MLGLHINYLYSIKSHIAIADNFVHAVSNFKYVYFSCSKLHMCEGSGLHKLKFLPANLFSYVHT